MSLLKNTRRAFTIIELLVSITVTAVMVTLMLGIVINVLGIWNRSSGSLNTGNQARLLLDQITQDLQGAIIRRDGNPWLIATMQRDQTTASGDSGMGTNDVFLPRWNPTAPLTYKPRGVASFDPAATRTSSAFFSLNLAVEDRGKLENIRFGQAGVWLRFFTTPPNENVNLDNLSAPVAVSYQLVRAHVGGRGAARTTPISYMLFRSVVFPNATFANGYDLATRVEYNTANGASGNPGNVRQPNENDVIANNVIDFGIRIYHRNAAQELVESFPVLRNSTGGLAGSAPANAPFSYVATSAPNPAFLGYGGTAAQTRGGIPELFDVMVRILTPEGATLIQAFEDNPANFGVPPADLDAKWWEIAEGNSTVYTRRVELRSRAL